MDNHFPLRLKNVHYYIMSGEYSWAGELVITKGVIYFFPVRDLIEEREKTSKSPSPVGYLSYKLNLKLADFFKRNKSYLDERNLMNLDDNEENLRNKLDKHLAGIKQEKDDQIFSYFDNSKRNKLPSPMRFEVGNIQNIVLTSERLHFGTVADKHDFKLTKSQAPEIYNALSKGGFAVSDRSK